MEKALVNAIYYADEDQARGNIMTEVYFDGTPIDFKDVIGRLRDNLKVRTLFGNNDNICYQILDHIGKSYHSLLLRKISSLLIITRHDDIIKITKRSNKNTMVSEKAETDDDKNTSTGIIKIDAVLAELNISEVTKPSKWYNKLWWMGLFSIIYLTYNGHIEPRCIIKSD